MSQENCIFCRMIAGEIAADIAYRDEHAIVIRDINPQAPIHLLVIPIEHIDSLDDAAKRQEPALGHMLRVVARVANNDGLADGGYRTVINTGAGAGQSVSHLHMHVLGGRPMSWPPG
ncbi:MAG TPA: histidine triad nucleotide-binding protein [Pyrinomonadaceae bacterium]|nr:histidine triad nucleotide-binding protein [Pyrinomonadaceae bacterium]